MASLTGMQIRVEKEMPVLPSREGLCKEMLQKKQQLCNRFSSLTKTIAKFENHKDYRLHMIGTNKSLYDYSSSPSLNKGQGTRQDEQSHRAWEREREVTKLDALDEVQALKYDIRFELGGLLIDLCRLANQEIVPLEAAYLGFVDTKIKADETLLDTLRAKISTSHPLLPSQGRSTSEKIPQDVWKISQLSHRIQDTITILSSPKTERDKTMLTIHQKDIHDRYDVYGQAIYDLFLISQRAELQKTLDDTYSFLMNLEVAFDAAIWKHTQEKKGEHDGTAAIAAKESLTK